MTESTHLTSGNFIGGLYNLKGVKLTSVSLELPEINIVIEKIPVAISVIPATERVQLGQQDQESMSYTKMPPWLQIESCVSFDNEEEARKNALEHYEMEVRQLKRDQKAIRETMKNALEEEENNYLKEEKETEVEPPTESIGDRVTKWLRQLTEIKIRLAELETYENDGIEFEYLVKTGATATIKPGLMSTVSFLPYPIIWIPHSLAEETTGTLMRMKQTCTIGLKMTYPSKIINEVNKRKLWMILGKKPCLTLKHLYDTNANIDNRAFARSVLNKGNILTIIKSSNGFIFGCLIVDTFEDGPQKGWIRGNENNCLFSLGRENDSKFPLVKLLKVDPNHHGVHITPHCGLHVSDAHDLIICNKQQPCVSSGHFVKVAPGFSNLPEGCASIAGEDKKFNIVHLEVYQVTS